MAIIDIIPALDDQELANLKANAIRLEGAGTPKQKTDAAELMPLIEAELAERLARTPPKPKRAPPKRKAAAKAEPEAEAESEEAELSSFAPVAPP